MEDGLQHSIGVGMSMVRKTRDTSAEIKGGQGHSRSLHDSRVLFCFVSVVTNGQYSKTPGDSDTIWKGSSKENLTLSMFVVE